MRPPNNLLTAINFSPDDVVFLGCDEDGAEVGVQEKLPDHEFDIVRRLIREEPRYLLVNLFRNPPDATREGVYGSNDGFKPFQTDTEGGRKEE